MANWWDQDKEQATAERWWEADEETAAAPAVATLPRRGLDQRAMPETTTPAMPEEAPAPARMEQPQTPETLGGTRRASEIRDMLSSGTLSEPARAQLEQELAILDQITPQIMRGVREAEAETNGEADPFEAEGMGALAKRRGQQTARGATEVVASVPESLAIGREIEERGVRDNARAALAGELPRVRELRELLNGPGAANLAEPTRQQLQAELETLQLLAPQIAEPAANREITPARETPLYQRGDAIRQASEDTFGAPDPRDTSFWGKVSEGLGNMGGMALTSVAAGMVGGPAAGLAAGAAIGSALNTPALYKEAIEAGADEETALEAARWGTAIGASEIIPITRALKLLPASMRREAGGAFLRNFTHIAKSSGEEAAQEYLATVANNIVAQKLYDPDRGWTEGALEAAAVGAVLGGGMGAAGAAMDRNPKADSGNPPPSIDTERRDSPRLNERDRASPLRNDLIDDGKRLMDEATSGAPPAPRAPKIDPSAGALPQAQPAPAAPRAPQGLAQPPLTPDALPTADPAPSAPSATDEAPAGNFEEMDEIETVDGEARPTGRRVRVNLDTGQAEPIDPSRETNEAGSIPTPAPTPELDSGPDVQPEADLFGEPVAPERAAENEAAEAETAEAAGVERRNITTLTEADVPNIATDAKTFQYKDGGDENGVTERLRGIKKWEPTRAGLAIVYEYEDGRRVIADGHQRLGLAKKLAAEGQEIDLPVYVIREADGHSPAYARRVAAEKNIAEGSGTALDAAKVLRESGRSMEDANLPPASVMARDADGIAKLSDDAFGMVVNEVASEKHGALVGKLVTDPARHRDVLATVAKVNPSNQTQAEFIVREAIRDEVSEQQDSLFGMEEVKANLVEERAKVLDRTLKDLGREISTFKVLKDRGDTITEAGNVLNDDANASRLDESGRARATLMKAATQKGPISDALSAAARAVRDGGKVSDAARQFAEAVRQAEAGEPVTRAGAPAGGARNGDGQAQGGQTQGLTPEAPAPTAPVTEQTEAGTQTVIPGAEQRRRVSQKTLDSIAPVNDGDRFASPLNLNGEARLETGGMKNGRFKQALILEQGKDGPRISSLTDRYGETVLIRNGKIEADASAVEAALAQFRAKFPDVDWTDAAPKPRREQAPPPAGGLFDDGAQAQTDINDLLGAPAPKPSADPAPDPAPSAPKRPGAQGYSYKIADSLTDKQKKNLAKWRGEEVGQLIGELDAVARRAEADVRARGLDVRELDAAGRDKDGNYVQMGFMVREAEGLAADLLDRAAEKKSGALDALEWDEDTGELADDQEMNEAYAARLFLDTAEAQSPPVNEAATGTRRPGAADLTQMDPAKVFAPPQGKTVNIDVKQKKSAQLAQEEANRIVQGWRETAAEIGATVDNSNKVIISLFDYTGAWAQPWRDAGYKVVQHDIKAGSDVIFDSWIAEQIEEMRGDGMEIYGVLSACPCTTYAGSGARWWKDRHDKEDVAELVKVFGPKAPASGAKSAVEFNNMLVDETRNLVRLANPTGFHALENPIGRIQEKAKMPDPAFRFQPHNFGDPYTKRTQIWGDVKTDLPVADVDPTDGSKMQSQYRGDDPLGKEMRSTTPSGFAYAFFMANDPTARKALGTKPAEAQDERYEEKAGGGSTGSAPPEADTDAPTPAQQKAIDAVAEYEGRFFLKPPYSNRVHRYEDRPTFRGVSDAAREEGVIHGSAYEYSDKGNRRPGTSGWSRMDMKPGPNGELLLENFYERDTDAHWAPIQWLPKDFDPKKDPTGKAFLESQNADNGNRGDSETAQAEGVESPAEAAVAKTPKPAPAKEKIEDFGEKIVGAAKDLRGAYSKSLDAVADTEIADQPLSKSFPAPDYAKLLEDGADPWTVAFVHAARDTIPVKPRQSWKLAEWTAQVQTLRGFAQSLLDGQIEPDAVQAALDKRPRLGLKLKVGIELYQVVGHEASLKGVSMSRSTYSLIDGKVQNPPLKRWEITRAAKGSSFSNMPRVLAHGDTEAAAIAAFKAKFDPKALAETAKTKAPRKFSIYSYRGREGFYVGAKIGRDTVDLAQFDTVAEARKMVREQPDELEATLQRLRDVPSERRSANAPRVGKDHRGGLPVRPEEFGEAFGFRGVQFGNYVENDRRQADLNEAYDALMDLAGVLGVDPKALSLNGELGLAFGARGKGGKNAGAAHYEADQVVINLTKRSGAGSLGHEWFHAVDNYFERSRGRPLSYMIDGNRAPKGEAQVRPEVVEAFGKVREAIRKTGMPKRSDVMDRTRSKPYWNTNIELGARAFESYLIAKLADQNGANDYLANIADEAVFNAELRLQGYDQDGFPYPTDAEMKDAIRPAFDNLFEAIETKQTPKGVAMFSVGRRNLDRQLIEEIEPAERFMFAGPQAETADIHALASAKDRLEAGTSSEVVRKETGWFRGVDGKWRYEITDEDARLTEAAAELENGDDVPLGDLLEHDRLYAAYPDIKLLSVRADDGIKAWGSVDIHGSQVTLNLRRIRAEGGDILSILLHEAQHLVQRREGFAQGGSQSVSEQVKEALQSLAQYRTSQRERFTQDYSNLFVTAQKTKNMVGYAHMWQDFGRLIDYAKMDRPSGVFRHIRGTTEWWYTPLIQENADLRARAHELNRSLYALPKRGPKRNAFLRQFAFDNAQLLRDAVPDAAWDMLEADTRQTKSVLNALQRESRKASAELKPFYELQKGERIAKAQADGVQRKHPFEVYQLLAGEVEARNTENRAKLTEAERRDTPPSRTQTVDRATYSGNTKEQVSDEDVIVVLQTGELETPMIANFDPAPSTPSAPMNEMANGAIRWSLSPEAQERAHRLGRAINAEFAKSGLPGFTTQVTERLFGTLESGDTFELNGAYYSGAVLVNLTGTQDPLATARHEMVHALRDPSLWGRDFGLFRKAEWDALEAAAAKDPRLTDKAALYRGEARDVVLEEIIADMYADWAAGRSEPKGFVKAAFERIKAAIDAIRRALGVAGLEGPDAVFKRIESGELGRRGARGATAQARDAQGRFQAAYHGTPFEFDRFSTDFMGAGEGAQAFGWGLYFASSKALGEQYRDRLSFAARDRAAPPQLRLDGKAVPAAIARELHEATTDLWLGVDELTQAQLDDLVPGLSSEARAVLEGARPDQFTYGKVGRLYEVDVPENDELLDWDKPLSEQSGKVFNALQQIPNEVFDAINGMLEDNGMSPYENWDDMTGAELIRYMQKWQIAESLPPEVPGSSWLDGDTDDKKHASLYLRSLGIPGHRFLDGNSRSKGEGSYNYVIYDEGRVNVLAKFSVKGESSGTTREAFGAYRKAKAEADRLTDAMSDGADARAAFAAFGRVAEARARLAAAIAEDAGGIELANQSGTLFAAVTKSQAEGFEWRTTVFNDTGFLGHTEHKTKLAAATQAVDEGYTVEDRGAMRRALTPKAGAPKFSISPRQQNRINNLGGPNGPFVPNRRMWDEMAKAQGGIWAKLKAGRGGLHDAVDRARVQIQDRFLPILRAQEAVERGPRGKLPLSQDAYRAEETFTGKVGRRLFEIDEEFTKPVIDLIAETKGALTSDDVGKWLTARHAIERNAHIAKINPAMPDGGAGMTNAEARTILTQAQQGAHAARLDQIGKMIDDLREKTIQLREDAGLLSPAEARVWRSAYKHYVPLKGFAETDHSDAVLDVTGMGRRFNTRGAESQRAMGRESEAFNPLQAAITQAQEVAIRAEKNMVGQALYRLVSANPSSMWEAKQPKQARYYNKSTGLVETRTDPAVSLFLDPNEMAVKIKGEEHRILFHDARLARAAGTVGADQMGAITQLGMKFSQWFSAVNTMLNPEFVVANAFRDITAAQVNIRNFGKADRDKLAKAMIRNWGKAFRGAYRGQLNKTDTEWARYYREFDKSGAKVSFWKMEQPESGRNELERRIKYKGGNVLERAGRFASLNGRDNPVLGFIERTNLAVDNAVRLAAYVEARRAGWSESDAASLSKNLTVNFNRRGEVGSQINAFYPFFNAAIQGTQILLKAGSSKRVRKLMLAMLAAGVLEDQVNAWLSEEDEDDELAWDKVPDWKQRRNMMLMPPDSGNPISIPLPYGYNVFPYAGKQLSKVMRGVKEPGDALGDLLAAAFESVSPISGQTVQEAITPTALQPIVEVTFNRDWQGRAIRPEDPYADYGPNAYKHYPGVTSASKTAADLMNRVTGGNRTEGGLVDVSPEYIDHLFGFAAGGAGRFAGRTTDLAVTLALGSELERDELTVNDVPFARQLRYNTEDWLDQERYYRFRGEVREAVDAVKVGRENREPVSAETQKKARLATRLKLIDKRVTDLRSRINAIEANERLSKDERKARRADIEKLRNKAMLTFNAQFVDALGAQGE